MRRLLAISLLLLFGLPLVSPLFALTTSSEANLAACCRRNGAHHCMGSMQMGATGSGTHISAIPPCCESFPKAVTAAQHHDLGMDTAPLAFAEVVSHPAIHRQTEARARVALDRARQKRGPPCNSTCLASESPHRSRF